MGEAKRRGTFEQRRAIAVEKRLMDGLKKKGVKDHAEACLTDEQRDMRSRMKLKMAAFMGIAASLFGGK